MKILLIMLALVLNLASRASAGLLLEPYVGYQTLLFDATFGDAVGPFTGQGLKVDGSGLGFGIRAGYGLANIFFALDYSSVNLKGTIKEQPAGGNLTASDLTLTALGLTAGASLGIVRPYLGYILDNQSKSSTSTTYGTSIKIGVGFSLMPKLTLNAEYYTANFTKSRSSSGVESTFGQTETFKTFKASGFGLNLSAPFEF